MTVSDVIRASQMHQTYFGHAPKLIGLNPSDYVCFDNGTGLVIYVGGVLVVECPDTEEGTVEVLKP